jgi:hypothetical protein
MHVSKLISVVFLKEFMASNAFQKKRNDPFPVLNAFRKEKKERNFSVLNVFQGDNIFSFPMFFLKV